MENKKTKLSKSPPHISKPWACLKLQVSSCSNLCPLIISKRPVLVFWELNGGVGDLLCHGLLSSSTAWCAGRPSKATALAWLMKLTQTEEDEDGIVICVCFGLYLPSLVCLPLFCKCSFVCIFLYLLSLKSKKQEEETVSKTKSAVFCARNSALSSKTHWISGTVVPNYKVKLVFIAVTPSLDLSICSEHNGV